MRGNELDAARGCGEGWRSRGAEGRRLAGPCWHEAGSWRPPKKPVNNLQAMEAPGEASLSPRGAGPAAQPLTASVPLSSQLRSHAEASAAGEETRAEKVPGRHRGGGRICRGLGDEPAPRASVSPCPIPHRRRGLLQIRRRTGPLRHTLITCADQLISPERVISREGREGGLVVIPPTTVRL